MSTMCQETPPAVDSFPRRTTEFTRSVSFFTSRASASYPQYNQWDFQDPKMEVLYHIRPYFVGIFPEI